MPPSRKPLPARISTLVAAYAAFAALWILLSDRVMGWLVRDPDELVLASTAKGWLFVAVTSGLLYALVSRFARAMTQAQRRELELERERDLPQPMLKAIAEASPDAIFAKDDEGRYLLVNGAAARAAGLGPSRCWGTTTARSSLRSRPNI